jgi:hypothetical protein
MSYHKQLAILVVHAAGFGPDPGVIGHGLVLSLSGTVR